MQRLARRCAVLVVMAAGTSAFSAIARAQDVPDRAAATEVRKQFLLDLDTLQSKYLALAEAIPAEKYSWRPAPGVRSIGEVFMHVASEYYIYVPMSFGAERSPVIAKGQPAVQAFEKMSTKPDVLKHLKEGFAYAQSAVGGVDPANLAGSRKLFGGNYTILETSLGMAADMHEHLGQLIAYSRMNGVKPPWSK
ncbi:MAG: DinB family protein [Gemmatimonadales bacterium]